MSKKVDLNQAEYEQRLKKVENLNHHELIVFLTNNNVVVAITNHWLIIENCKYNQKDPYGNYTRKWLTAFTLSDSFLGDSNRVDELMEYAYHNELAVHMHPEDERTLDIEHYHLTEIPDRNWDTE